MGSSLFLTLIKQRLPNFDKVSEGVPLIIVDHGKPLHRRMDKTKVDIEDVLHAARLNFGLERMEQIKYAVLEKDGTISIIPYKN